MRPYAKTLYEPYPETRIITAFPTANTAAIYGNPFLFMFDVQFAALVAMPSLNYRELKKRPVVEKSDLPVSYKADEK